MSSTNQPSATQPSSQPQSTYGSNRGRGATRGGASYRGGTRGRGSGNQYRGNRGRGRGGGEASYYDREERNTHQTPRGVNLPTADGGPRGAAAPQQSTNRFSSMLGGGVSRGGKSSNQTAKATSSGEQDGGKSMASQKFDALFGAPSDSAAAATDQAKGQAVDLDALMAEEIAPSKKAGSRKQSNVEQTRDTRTQSNVSASSGNRQLEALFPKDEAVIASVKEKPTRKRYSKQEMLSRFKQTTELDMTVFEPDRILDYADLFVSGTQKPSFKSSKKVADDGEEKDPLDDMIEEAEDEKADTQARGIVPESMQATQKKPAVALQAKSGFQQNNKTYQKPASGYGNNNNYQNKQNYRPHAAGNFAAFDEEDDIEPEWNDFDPEKQTGGFFGREIPEEAKLRQNLEDQKERWGGQSSKKNVDNDQEDEFDAMFVEAVGDKEEPKQIGASQNENVEEVKAPEEEDIAGAKTLEQMSEEVPQDIKEQIINLEVEQQEKLRQTMLRNTFQPKTSALKNLQDIFQDYPVVTNESLKLKMENVGQIQTDDSEELINGLNSKQHVFSRLLTSINPFAQFVLREMVESADTVNKNWELDKKILQRHPGEEIKPEHLLKTSSEMFSIYLYTKDPMMLIKSDKYTQGEFKAVKDLINMDDSLLVSSQMANSLLVISQHEKMLKEAQEGLNRQTSGSEAPAAAPNSTSKARDNQETSEQERASKGGKPEESTEAAPAAGGDNENDVLADLNAQLKNMLMGE